MLTARAYAKPAQYGVLDPGRKRAKQPMQCPSKFRVVCRFGSSANSCSWLLTNTCLNAQVALTKLKRRECSPIWALFEVFIGTEVTAKGANYIGE